MPMLLHEQDFDWSLLEEIETKQPKTPPPNEDDFFAAAKAAIDIAHGVFCKVDVDSSGALDAQELSNVVVESLRALGAQVPSDIEQVSHHRMHLSLQPPPLLGYATVSLGGECSRSVFLSRSVLTVSQALTGSTREQYVSKTMERFDKDHSGVLEFPE